MDTRPVGLPPSLPATPAISTPPSTAPGAPADTFTPNSTVAPATAVSSAPGKTPEPLRVASAREATLYRPLGSEPGAGFEATHKALPCRSDLVAACGSQTLLVTVGEDGRDSVRCARQDGALAWAWSGAKASDTPVQAQAHRVGWFEVAPELERVYVRTGDALWSLDLATGEERGRFDFPSTSFARRFEVLPDGRVLCASFEDTRVLDRDLGTSQPLEAGMHVGRIRPLAGGETLLLDDGYPARLRILGPDGSKRFESEAVQHSVSVDDRGDVWFLKAASLFPGHAMGGGPGQALRYSPASGKTEPVPATNMTTGLLPLAGGSYLLLHNMMDRPALYLQTPEGTRAATFDFKESPDGVPSRGTPSRYEIRQFLLEEGEGRAWALVDRRYADDSREQVLFRLDLSGGPKLKEGARGEIFESPPADPCHAVYAIQGDERVVPVALRSGQVALFRKDGIDVIDAEGRRTGQYADLSTLERSLGSLDEVAKRCRFGDHGDPDPAPRMGGMLDLARYFFRYPEPRDPSPAAVVKDGSVEFRRRAEDADALADMGLGDRAAYEQMLVSPELLDTVLQGSRAIPFPGALGSLEASLKEIRIRIDGEAGQEARIESLVPPPGGEFSAVAPFSVGKRTLVAAGTQDGQVLVADLSTVPVRTRRFRAGGPVQAIQAAGPDRLRAVSTDGSVLVVPVPVAPGETLEGRARPAPSSGGDVVVEDEQVVVGGVRIPRRTRREEGS